MYNPFRHYTHIFKNSNYVTIDIWIRENVNHYVCSSMRLTSHCTTTYNDLRIKTYILYFMTKRVRQYTDLYTIVFSSAVSSVGEKRIIFSFHILFIFSNVLTCFKNISLIFLKKILFGFVFTTSILQIEYHIRFTSFFCHMLYLLQPIVIL